MSNQYLEKIAGSINHRNEHLPPEAYGYGAVGAGLAGYGIGRNMNRQSFNKGVQSAISLADSDRMRKSIPIMKEELSKDIMERFGKEIYETGKVPDAATELESKGIQRIKFMRNQAREALAKSRTQMASSKTLARMASFAPKIGLAAGAGIIGLGVADNWNKK